MEEKVYYVGKIQLTEYNAKYPNGRLRRSVALQEDVVCVKIVKEPKNLRKS